jgi:hypothetical protein
MIAFLRACRCNIRTTRPSPSAELRSRDFTLGQNIRFWPMLSKKFFGGNKQNFLKLLTRFVRSDVRDHIAYQKNDHGPS